MFKTLLARTHQGYRTIKYPTAPVSLPDRFAGRPAIDHSKCQPGCQICSACCPTDAIDFSNGALSMDLGRCLYCAACERACPHGAIQFTTDYRQAVSRRHALRYDGRALELAGVMSAPLRRVFGRSLKLRQVSAGGCNACEADVNVLNTVVYDLGRFGIQFVASPRHADGLLVTGPVTTNMKRALEKTWKAVPPPKVVIAVGACAISGGPYVGHPEQHGGADSVVPVSLYIPGCPPHPMTILDGLLRWLGRLDKTGG